MTGDDRGTSHLLVIVGGPTGVGKTSFSIELALRLGGEIVNCDSIQFYEGFDLGSAKPTPEERSTVPHHLFDIASPDRPFTVRDFVDAAEPVIASITARNALPILVGGTGFYARALTTGLPELPSRDEALRARLKRIAAAPGGARRLHRLLQTVDPRSAARIAPGDRHRIERAIEVYRLTGRPISETEPPRADTPPRMPVVRIALTAPRDLLRSRLDERVDAMYEAGLIEETRHLLTLHDRTAEPFRSIGYREACEVLDGIRTIDDAREKTRSRTRAYAKRQLTWWRAERDTLWLDTSKGLEAIVDEAAAVVRVAIDASNEG